MVRMRYSPPYEVSISFRCSASYGHIYFLLCHHLQCKLCVPRPHPKLPGLIFRLLYYYPFFTFVSLAPFPFKRVAVSFKFTVRVILPEPMLESRQLEAESEVTELLSQPDWSCRGYCLRALSDVRDNTRRWHTAG
jgi:hypothetical protein